MNKILKKNLFGYQKKKTKLLSVNFKNKLKIKITDKLIIKNKPPSNGIGYFCNFLLLSG
jgi:hypothetical protein